MIHVILGLVFLTKLFLSSRFSALEFNFDLLYTCGHLRRQFCKTSLSIQGNFKVTEEPRFKRVYLQASFEWGPK